LMSPIPLFLFLSMFHFCALLVCFWFISWGSLFLDLISMFCPA
jgi:hypothetical protein